MVESPKFQVGLRATEVTDDGQYRAGGKNCIRKNDPETTIPVFSLLLVRAHKVILPRYGERSSFRLTWLTCLATEASSHHTDFPSSYYSAPDAVLTDKATWNALQQRGDVQRKRMLDSVESLYPFIV